MGMISDFFRCSPESLGERFPGWVTPDPGWMPGEDDGGEVNLDGLELLQMTGLGDPTIESLLSALCPGQELEMKPPLVSPTAEATVSELPEAAVAALEQANEQAVKKATELFVEAQRADLATIENASTRGAALQGCTVEEWLPALRELARFSRRTRHSGAPLFRLICV